MPQQATPQHLAFLEQLARLNGAMAELLSSGNLALFAEMHAAIRELYKLQHGNDDEVFRAIDPDCEVIYENFDMILALFRTAENDDVDEPLRKALNKLLHNIDGAVINIASLLGAV